MISSSIRFPTVAWGGFLSLAGSVALVVVATAGFFLGASHQPKRLRLSHDDDDAHDPGGGPLRHRAGHPPLAHAVIIGQQELIVFRGRREFGRWPWEQLAHTSGIGSSFNARRMLKLYGNSGKVLVRLTDNLRDFDTLAAEIKRRMTQSPSAHAPKSPIAPAGARAWV